MFHHWKLRLHAIAEMVPLLLLVDACTHPPHSQIRSEWPDFVALQEVRSDDVNQVDYLGSFLPAYSHRLHQVGSPPRL